MRCISPIFLAWAVVSSFSAIALAAPPLVKDSPETIAAPPIPAVPEGAVAGVTVVAPKRRTVQDFIWHAGAAASDGQLARWHEEICPRAEGVPPFYANYFEERVRQAARSVGAPLAPQRCDANLVIYFTPDPAKTLAALSQKNSWVFGRGQLKAALAEAAAQEPIFWTHNVFTTPADGSAGQRSCRRGGCFLEIDHVVASRLQTSVVDSIGVTAVIVDTRKVKGMGFGSVSDYIPMVALGQFNPADVSADMPTILNLFKARDQGRTVPPGLTDWDRAYLTGLYATQPNLSAIAQRGKIYQHLRQGPGISDDPAR
jgi:hypothetical protein